MKKSVSFDYSGRVALITGGADGIGRATALAFAESGASVAVADCDTKKGEEILALLAERGKEGLFIQSDVSKPADVETLLESTLSRFGRLDFAFNNAGILGEQLLLAENNAENWNRVIGVNLTGVFLCMLHEIPALLRTGGGVIVNNASIVGTVAFPASAPYTASKHGVIGLTKTAALEYAKSNIRVNAVCPGFIGTKLLEGVGITPANEMGQTIAGMHPLGRFGTPEEIAGVILWLCSDQASFVTGHALLADGGYTAQ